MNDVIYRQAAIDALNVGAELLRRVLDDADIVGAERAKYEWGLGLIESYISDMKELPSAQPEQRWIPVTEKLPEDGKKHYWVCTDTGYQCECRWTNINHFWTDLTTDWHWHIMDIPQYSAVIAWMPLPEPWKEGETE